jgi:hypothetical protein
MLLNFPFCRKDKATKAGYPQPVAGIKGYPHNKATIITTTKAPTDDDGSQKLETLIGLIVFGQYRLSS